MYGAPERVNLSLKRMHTVQDGREDSGTDSRFLRPSENKDAPPRPLNHKLPLIAADNDAITSNNLSSRCRPQREENARMMSVRPLQRENDRIGKPCGGPRRVRTISTRLSGTCAQS